MRIRTSTKGEFCGINCLLQTAHPEVSATQKKEELPGGSEGSEYPHQSFQGSSLYQKL